MNLADALVPKHYSDGEQIIKQGDTADGMYFVEEGIVRITIVGENDHEIEVHLYIIVVHYFSCLKRKRKRYQTMMTTTTTAATTSSLRILAKRIPSLPRYLSLILSRRLIVSRLAVIWASWHS